MDKDTDSAKDVPVTVTSVTSSPSTPTTSAATDVSARRSCRHCGRRMSSLQFDKQTLCVVCRDMKCSVDTRCKECKAWSKEFMLGYVKHQRSLVSKAKKPATTSPSPPVTAVTTAPVVSLPSLSFSEDRIRQLMHSMFQDFMQSGSLGINQPSTAPPAVPDSATKNTEATGGLRSVMPVEAPSTESPGVVLPTNQEDLPPPHTVSVCVSYVARSGDSNVGGSLSSGVGLTRSVSRGTDHLRVINVVSVASALSPGSLLFPFSDSGFASLSAASSSCPLSLPPPPLPSPLLLWLRPLFFLLFLLLLLLFLLLPLFLLPWLLLLSPLAPLSRLRPLFLLLLAFLLLPPSVSSPLPSSSFLSASSNPSLAYSFPPVCASSSAGQAASLVVSSSSYFSSSSLDFASYQASVLGLSLDYQYLARWYFQSGGSDFRAYLSAFYPHLSSDASRDFASGSSVFFSALHSVASSVPLPPLSSAALPLPSSSPAVPSFQPTAPLPSAPPFSAPSSVSLTPSLGSLSAPRGWGVSALGSPSVVSSAPPGFPPLSAPSSLLSVPPPAVSTAPSLPPAAPVLALPSSSLFSLAPSALSDLISPALGSSPAVSVVPPLPPGPQPSLLRYLTLRCSPLRLLRLH